MSKKESPIIDTWCCAMLDNSLPCGKKVLKREAFLDCLGHYWCDQHQWRGRLLDWAARSGYPDVITGLYGMGPGREVWELQVLLGKQAMVEAVVQALGLESEEVA